MNETESRDDGRSQDLFVGALLFGLTDDEHAELERLRGNSDSRPDALAESVGALDRAWSDLNPEPLPDHLRSKILSDARSEFSWPWIPPAEARPESRRATPSRRLLRTFSFAAAMLLVAVFVTIGFVQRQNVAVKTAAQMRAELIASVPDLIRLDWSEGPTPIPGANGDLVWSPSRQMGFMRFRGMPVNSPTVEQYQLWIFDKNQDEKTPIDGGVFDIPAREESVIPIHPKLAVQNAYLFAITVEKPGGVVVSSRTRLPLLAAVE